MAIEIIRRGQKKQCTCKKCGSVLSYEPSDVQIDTGGVGNRSSRNQFITCPVCNEKIPLRTTR